MSASPMIVIVRIGPAAPGLRDIPSAAAEVARPCAIAPAAAATPSRNAAPSAPAPQLPAVRPAGSPASWASAGRARQTRARAIQTTVFFRISKLSLFVAAPGSSVLLVGRCEADVDRRQGREYERLEGGGEEAETHERPGNDDRGEAREDARRRVLPVDVHEEPKGQGQDPGEVADHLDDEEERREPEDRSHEVLE